MKKILKIQELDENDRCYLAGASDNAKKVELETEKLDCMFIIDPGDILDSDCIINITFMDFDGTYKFGKNPVHDDVTGDMGCEFNIYVRNTYVAKVFVADLCNVAYANQNDIQKFFDSLEKLGFDPTF